MCVYIFTVDFEGALGKHIVFGSGVKVGNCPLFLVVLALRGSW